MNASEPIDDDRPARRALLAKIHIARRDLGLDEASYRALLAAETAKHSAADCDRAELARVVARFERLGWRSKVGGGMAGPTASAKRHVRKVFALWTDLGRLGALDDGSRSALGAFVKRMAGVDEPEWLDVAGATGVTEALKAMRARHLAKVAGRMASKLAGGKPGS
ncbi:gp16 family protein [Phreatobacter stygius]|uniref:Regulatory protein GemA n=1 Tax=Phreatobacter stygius TaxID=1940610 RepID=A0A4D7AZ03_9HYPH|nr:regulatory protein GemA [Phreatobacter stygius]QCI65541.1 regulatory protein GemA [Phreatobacter stygius]